jgi:hypothetical protein
MPTTTKRWLLLPVPPPPDVGAKKLLCLMSGRFVVSYSVPHQVRMHEAS